MKTTTGDSGGRPMFMSTRGVVTSGHYLATSIGVDVLRRGGNAMDAAAATGFALAVLQPNQNGIAGEAPMLVYSTAQNKVHAISGHGTAPAEATLERFLEYGFDLIPGDGFLPAIVPATVAAHICLLQNFGTMRLADVLAPAVELARNGFPMYEALHNSIKKRARRFRNEWPTSAEAFMPGGKPVPVGAVFRQPDWARTLGRLVAADRRFKRRDAGLRAAYNEFYRGKIAETIVEFCRNNAIRDASGEAHAGLLSREDFDTYTPVVEESVCTEYRGVTVHKCNTWTQGPVMLQTLNLLENFDLAGMGLNSADYIHTVVECMKLAFADREFYYGDPDFADVPIAKLLSREYAAERVKLIDAAKASLELRPGGRPAIKAESITAVDRAFKDAAGCADGDTTKLDVIDKDGNMVSVTQSGGWLHASPVVPGLGFPLGTRGQMFSLVAGHPNCIAPGKRPRTTLTPTLAMKGSKPFMVFGSPGGDRQDQWGLEAFLNVVEFDLSLQEAVEAPTFWSAHWPNSFYPRAAEPGKLTIESRVPKSVRRELASRGHLVIDATKWKGGNTHMACIAPKTGVRCAAASPRYPVAYAGGV